MADAALFLRNRGAAVSTAASAAGDVA